MAQGIFITVTDTASPALEALRKGVTSKAKLQSAARPAASLIKRKLGTAPPKWTGRGKSKDGRTHLSRGVGLVRPFRGYSLVSGNLRKSSLIVAGLRKTSLLVVGHRWGSISPGAMVGSTKKGARGFYGHWVNSGTGIRTTSKGKNRGAIRRNNYMLDVMSSAPTALRLVEKGFIDLLAKEKRRVGLTE